MYEYLDPEYFEDGLYIIGEVLDQFKAKIEFCSIEEIPLPTEINILQFTVSFLVPKDRAD